MTNKIDYPLSFFDGNTRVQREIDNFICGLLGYGTLPFEVPIPLKRGADRMKHRLEPATQLNPCIFCSLSTTQRVGWWRVIQKSLEMKPFKR